jgi:hypothetical protein
VEHANEAGADRPVPPGPRVEGIPAAGLDDRLQRGSDDLAALGRKLGRLRVELDHIGRRCDALCDDDDHPPTAAGAEDRRHRLPLPNGSPAWDSDGSEHAYDEVHGPTRKYLLG